MMGTMICDTGVLGCDQCFDMFSIGGVCMYLSVCVELQKDEHTTNQQYLLLNMDLTFQALCWLPPDCGGQLGCVLLAGTLCALLL